METVALNSIKGRWIMAAAVLTSSMAFIDGTALNVVLPALQKNLGAGGSDLFWILNAYLMMLASLMLIGGSLGDRLGHKKVFMYGITLFIIGSAACGLSSNAFYLILFRLLQGAGGAFMIPGSLSIISSSINSDERGKAIGTWSSFTTLVMLGGPVLGGALADIGLWRYIFFINLPIGIIALLILWRHVEEPLPSPIRIPLDIWGALTIGSSLAAITYGILSSTSAGHQHTISTILVLTGVALSAVFILIEHRSKHPMMPLSLFQNLSFTGANLLTFFIYAALSGAMLFLSLNLVQVQGYNQLESGMAFLPFTLLVLIFAGFAGKLADKHGSRWFLTVGPFVSGAGILWLSIQGQTGGPASYWTTFFPGILVFGLGMAFTVAPLTSTVMGTVNPEFSGVASGINNAITRIANVLAYALLGALAVVVFSKTLHTQISDMPLSLSEKTKVLKEVGNLGNAKVPTGINPALKPRLNGAFHLSFINAFRLILRCAAFLMFAGGVIAFLTVKPEKR